MSSLGYWLDLSGTSNRYLQTYVKGFVDISGGNLIMRNNGIYVLNGDSSFNGNVTFMKRFAVGKSPDPTNNYAFEVSGSMFFGGGDVSFNGNATVNNNLSMGGLIQQDVTPVSTVVPQVIYAVPSALYGTGIAYLGSQNVFTQPNTFKSYVNMEKDLTITGNLYVQTNNSVTLNNYGVTNDLSLNGRLYVINDASFGGLVLACSDISANKRLFVGSDVSLGGRLFVEGDVSMNGEFRANYPASSIPPSAIITGISSRNILFTSDVSMTSKLYVAGDVSVNGQFRANYPADSIPGSAIYGEITNTFFKDVSMNSRLYVTGDLSAGSRVFVVGDVSLGGNLYIETFTVANNDVSMNGNLAVANVLTTNSLFNALGDVSANGCLFVGGDTSMNGNLFVTGSLIVQNSSTNNIINTVTTNVFNINEDLSLNGRLSSSGDASFGGNLYVEGNLLLPSVGTHTISGNVTMSGNSTCGNSVVTSNATIGGTETVTGLLTANGGLTVASGATLTLTGATITGLTTSSIGGISSYATTESLSSYATTTSLTSYAKLTGNTFTGNIYINTGTISNYPIEVTGYANTGSATSGWFYGSSGSSANNQSRNISIYVSNSIWASTGFLAQSDKRIKTNIQPIEDRDSLQRLLQLKPKTYTYIDTINNGTGTEYGFIAQDLLPIFDKAVTTIPGVIPNIYEMASVVKSTILTLQTKTTDLFTKDESGKYYPVKLYDESNNEVYVNIISVVDKYSFEIDTLIHNSHIFVYGQKIPDLHGIRWNDITTVNTSSIQALYSIIQTQKEEIAELKANMMNYDSMLLEIQKQLKTLSEK